MFHKARGVGKVLTVGKTRQKLVSVLPKSRRHDTGSNPMTIHRRILYLGKSGIIFSLKLFSHIKDPSQMLGECF